MAGIISVFDQVVSEADGFVDIIVRLDAPSASAITVDYATTSSGLTADAGGYDYTAISGTLTFNPGQVFKTIRVSLSEYSGVESLEHFRLNLSGAVNGTIAKSSAMISIVDNDTILVGPTIFVDDVVIDEKDGTATFVVTLNGASSSTVRVDYATGNAGATAGNDYTAKSGTLTFAAGETVKKVVVNITDDAAAEGPERFVLNLSNAVNANLLDNQAVANIGRSDGTTSTSPRIGVADMVVGESDGYIDVVVTLSAPSTLAVSVDYDTTSSGLTADAGGYDYVGVSGKLNFQAGETTKTVRIELSEYSGVEVLEHFRFNLSAATNATIEKASASIYIVDDDTILDTPSVFVDDVFVDEKAGTASFVVTLNGASNSTVTVDYATANAGASGGSDYLAKSGVLTFAAGETVKTVVVDITDDGAAEGAERFHLNLSNAVNANILDNRAVATIGLSDGTTANSPRISVADMVVGESDGYIDVVVELSAPSALPVSVDYTTTSSGLTADAGGYDYIGVSGKLNFAAGETLKTVRIQLSEYSGAEQLEHFRFNLSGATNSTIERASASIHIVDDDTVLEAPSLFVRDVVVDEKAGTASFVVHMNGSSNSTVTVDYGTGNAGATAGNDYTAASGKLIFAAGETAKTVVVNITDDAAAEGPERFNLNLSNAVNATILDGQGVATIGLSDGTTANSPRLSVADMVVGESDGYIDVVVKLSAPSTLPVTVNYTTTSSGLTADAGGYDYIGVAGALNFAAGETTQTVRVEISQYSGVENLEHFRFNLAGATNASIERSSATVYIVDNDTILDAPNLYVRDAVVDEKSGTASFIVYMDGSSNSTVKVNFATASQSAAPGSDYVSRSGTLTFAAGETAKTVVIDIRDDGSAEGIERFNVNLSNAVNANIADGKALGQIGVSDGATLGSPAISVTDVRAGEADGYIDVQVTLSAPSAQNVAVNYTTANGTATSGGYDYIGASGTLNFAAGQTSQTVRIELSQYSGAESTETFLFNLSGAVNASIANNSATVTLIDDDNGARVFSYGLANDTYRVTDTTDIIVENARGGIDQVNSSATYTLGVNLENLTLIGNGNINAFGNGVGNVITGDSGNNLIDGRSGDDTMTGGRGSDTYVVNTAGDVVVEAAGAGTGTDTVRSLISYTLGANLEQLVLTGAQATSGTGNAANNRLAGNSGDNALSGLGGNDTIVGGAGNDTLIGGGGLDAFQFDRALNADTNVDVITGFVAADDRILLDNAVFSEAGSTGALAAAAFRAGAAAGDASDRFIYHQASGNLFYDEDGNGAVAQVLFADLQPGAAMTAADLFVI